MTVWSDLVASRLASGLASSLASPLASPFASSSAGLQQGQAVSLALQWPQGRWGPSHSDVRLRFRRTADLWALIHGRIGKLASLYVDGQLEIEGELRHLMHWVGCLAGQPISQRRPWPWQAVWNHGLSVWRHRIRTDLRQVRFHYDLSDDFYGLWLDPRRVYSCAYFRGPNLDLAGAQEAKLDHICRKLDLRSGQRFLDIGAGWGGLLLWAAEHYGVQATGITLSRNQYLHVNRLIAERRLERRVRMQMLHWRDVPEDPPYDRIASVGMFEHVGRAQLGDYFAKIRRLLRPGGLAMNHGITAGSVYGHNVGRGMGDFIERHIFPGGELAHVAAVSEQVARGGLEMVDAENLRPHYARTLWAWSDALEARLDEAERLVGRAAVRAYRLYLAGCATGFEQGWMSLYQLLCTRPNHLVAGAAQTLRGAQSDYPFNREYIYRPVAADSRDADYTPARSEAGPAKVAA